MEYKTKEAIEIALAYKKKKTFYDKCEYLSKIEGVKLVVKDKRYWFEYYGKQITPTDFYIGSSLKRILNIFFGDQL